MKLKAAIFDFDGLILDTERVEFEAWSEVYAESGVRLEFDDWSVCIGTAGAFDPVAHLEKLLGRSVDAGAVLNAMKGIHAGKLAEAAVFPGVVERLDEARRLGIRLAVASSSSGNWVETNLRARGLRGYFEAVATRSERVAAKPRPDTYLEALRELGAKAPESVAMEDSANGIAAAKAAGLYCVAVPNELTRRLDLSAADLVVNSLAEITFSGLDRLLDDGRRTP